MTPAIRRARRVDLAAMVELDEHARVDAARAPSLRDHLENDTVLVAEVDGVVAGFAVVHHRFFGHSFVDLVVVARDRRRKGLGIALVRASEAYRTTDRVFVTTNQSNAPMQHLLSRAGYVPSGVIHNLDPADPELVYVRFPAD